MKFGSCCHSERSEESVRHCERSDAIYSDFQILRFAQNDKRGFR